MNGTTVTIVGNIARDPQLRYISTGQPVCSFTVADTPRRKDPATGEWVDGETLWWGVSAWGQLGENCAESLEQGTRVVVTGRIRPARAWTPKDGGDPRASLEITADEVAPSMRWASVKVVKTDRSKGGNGQASNGGGYGAGVPADDPWASGPAPAAATSGPPIPDEPPF